MTLNSYDPYQPAYATKVITITYSLIEFGLH